MPDLRPAARVPLLMLGMLSLIGGVLAGLARLDWSVGATAANAAGWHGGLMISAFLGTVISLERAVALARGWAYMAPAMAGIGGVAMLTGAPSILATGMVTTAAAILVAASIDILRRLVAPFTVTLAAGAMCWLIGNLVWLASGGLSAAVPWWFAFLILTIAGERLELTRLLPTPAIARWLFFLVVGVILTGATLSMWSEEIGLRLFAAGLLALAVWMLRFDIARRNATTVGLTRFIALSLLSGYCWLALAGLLGLGGGFELGHPWRDATLHAVALGFVFSMIFGHGPIIFPAVLQVKIPYHPMFYLPLLVLHGSLAVRTMGGLAETFSLRSEGGLVNAVALLIFIVTMTASVVRGRSAAAP